MTHDSFLIQIEAQLEQQVQEVIAVFQNLPEDRLRQPGPNGSWSISACFEHLNTYAQFYLPRLQKALGRAKACDPQQEFRHSILGSYFIRMMDHQRSKKKYSAMKKHRPENIQDPYAVIAAFLQHMETMMILLRKARHKNLVKTSVPTSISPLITMNAGDAIQFVLVHQSRHLEQARKILA